MSGEYVINVENGSFLTDEYIFYTQHPRVVYWGSIRKEHVDSDELLMYVLPITTYDEYSIGESHTPGGIIKYFCSLPENHIYYTPNKTNVVAYFEGTGILHCDDLRAKPR